MIEKLRIALAETNEKSNVFAEEYEQEKKDNIAKVEAYRVQLENEAKAHYDEKVHDLKIEMACITRLIDRFELEAQQEVEMVEDSDQYYGSEV